MEIYYSDRCLTVHKNKRMLNFLMDRVPVRKPLADVIVAASNPEGMIPLTPSD
jgi:hypothetical protein